MGLLPKRSTGESQLDDFQQSILRETWMNYVNKYTVGGVLGLLVLFLIWPFYSVPTGSRGVVTQFGKIVGIEGEGLAVLPPWQKLNNFSIRAEQADIEKAEGSTSDTQPVNVSMTVRYSVMPDKVAEVYEKYSHNGDLSSYVQTATMEVFKAVTSRYTAPDLIAKRSQVSGEINSSLNTKLSLYGAQVISIDMRNFSFSPSYMAAINDKVTQEQKRLAAENTLKTVEAEQKQKVAIAEAEARATVATAEAQAKSISLQGDALRSNSGLLELKRVEVELEKAKKWDGKLPQNIYAGAPIPFLDVGKKQ
jgi:regulator of protease activity HflC (stomatin/prohibitin superfamily)